MFFEFGDTRLSFSHTPPETKTHGHGHGCSHAHDGRGIVIEKKEKEQEKEPRTCTCDQYEFQSPPTLLFIIKDMVHNKRYGSMDPWIHGSAAGAAARAAAGAAAGVTVAASAATVCTYYVLIGGSASCPPIST